jgi:hypothetical protein
MSDTRKQMTYKREEQENKTMQPKEKMSSLLAALFSKKAV